MAEELIYCAFEDNEFPASTFLPWGPGVLLHAVVTEIEGLDYALAHNKDSGAQMFSLNLSDLDRDRRVVPVQDTGEVEIVSHLMTMDWSEDER